MAGQCVAVVSGKGGTGKTSFTAGVGSALAQMGQKVLCVDCDVALRNLDLALGLTDKAIMDFTDVAQQRCALEVAAVEHPDLPGLFLLTAPTRSRGRPVTEEQMSLLLEAARQRFDYCFLDAPAGLDSGFQLATCGADRCVVVATADASSLRDAQRTAGVLRDKVSRLHLVVNRVQPRLLRQLGTTIDDAMDTTGLPLLGLVPEDQQVMLCANLGRPLILYANRGAAIAYLNITRRLMGERAPLMRLR